MTAKAMGRAGAMRQALHGCWVFAVGTFAGEVRRLWEGAGNNSNYVGCIT